MVLSEDQRKIMYLNGSLDCLIVKMLSLLYETKKHFSPSNISKHLKKTTKKPHRV